MLNWAADIWAFENYLHMSILDVMIHLRSFLSCSTNETQWKLLPMFWTNAMHWKTEGVQQTSHLAGSNLVSRLIWIGVFLMVFVYRFLNLSALCFIHPMQVLNTAKKSLIYNNFFLHLQPNLHSSWYIPNTHNHPKSAATMKQKWNSFSGIYTSNKKILTTETTNTIKFDIVMSNPSFVDSVSYDSVATVASQCDTLRNIRRDTMNVSFANIYVQRTHPVMKNGIRTAIAVQEHRLNNFVICV